MARLSLATALAAASESELIDLHDRWVGGGPPVRRAELVQVLRERMGDPQAVVHLVSGLYGDLAPTFRLLAEHAGRGFSIAELEKLASQQEMADLSLRVALGGLCQTGLVVRHAADGPGGAVLWGVPEEIAAVLPDRDHLPSPGATSPLTLHGWLLGRMATGPMGADAVRKMYRLLSSEDAVMARLDGLDPEVRRAVDVLALRFGGLLPVGDFDALGHDGRLEDLAAVLEKHSLGAVQPLNLETFGLRQNGRVLLLFLETLLPLLRRHGKVAEEPMPESTASFGVDFISNFSRFASFVEGDTVRFTVRGTIYKSTGKRIAEKLLPNPGREFRRLQMLELEYRFALGNGFIDRTGERSFRLTPEGQDFLKLSLAEKQRVMLDWFIEDRELPGDLSHQLLLRRVVLRYLKRLEPETWYDAMVIPFAARNHLLAALTAGEMLRPDSRSFPVRAAADLQGLAWDLFVWVRKYLYLLGIVDLAYDDSGRCSALRLTRLGAELLDLMPGRALEASGHVVVNPDFEVVLFPDRRAHDIIHQLDRFAEREMADALVHYRITPGSLRRGLSEGLGLDDILGLLQERSRTPLPQNVAYSLESWARQGGLVTWHGDGRLACEKPELLDRLALHPELKRIGFERVAPEVLQLDGEVEEELLADWVRDYGASLRRAAS